MFKLLSNFFLKFFSFIECFFALSENEDHFEMAMRNFFEKKKLCFFVQTLPPILIKAYAIGLTPEFLRTKVSAIYPPTIHHLKMPSLLTPIQTIDAST